MNHFQVISFSSLPPLRPFTRTTKVTFLFHQSEWWWLKVLFVEKKTSQRFTPRAMGFFFQQESDQRLNLLQRKNLWRLLHVMCMVLFCDVFRSSVYFRALLIIFRCANITRSFGVLNHLRWFAFMWCLLIFCLIKPGTSKISQSMFASKNIFFFLLLLRASFVHFFAYFFQFFLIL